MRKEERGGGEEMREGKGTRLSGGVREGEEETKPVYK
jgi:hypothetical protein